METPSNLVKIASILKPYIEDHEFQNLKSSDHLVNDLNIDSADLVCVVLDVENSYGIVIEDAAIESIKTVADILTIVESTVDK